MPADLETPINSDGSRAGREHALCGVGDTAGLETCATPKRCMPSLLKFAGKSKTFLDSNTEGRGFNKLKCSAPHPVPHPVGRGEGGRRPGEGWYSINSVYPW